MVSKADSSAMIDLSKLNSKKNQHYVSKFYLKQWIGKDRIFVKRKDGEQSKVYDKRNADDVGTERYFYGIEIDEAVLDTLNYMFAEKSTTNKVLEQNLQSLAVLKLLDDVINKEIGIVNRDEALLENVKAAFKHRNLHHLEDSYEAIEQQIAAEIRNIANSEFDDNWFRPTRKTVMFIFILFGTQIFRTKEKMVELQRQIPEITLDRLGTKTTLTPEQRDSVLKCMLYFYAQEFSASLETSGCTLTITRNHTDLGYLTTDSPALVHWNPPAELNLVAYGAIPLSPRLMAHIHFPKVKENANVVKVIDVHDVNEVLIANRVIAKNPHSQLYAAKLEDFVRSGIDIGDYTEPAKDAAK
ncbi:hypothetical protein OX88_08785 [Pseudomonas coronafaciens pv. porri]|uniref:DUF4238 domain-containing protein n=1 Tax=Pseudomonas coronafaciens TaxID=53409 RepID=UPI0006ABAF94|nr:DUF4238 domain-containing protein [Pseudomonas coronafaciens]KOP56561.1 hypothetical protein OX88_08785 [Pseudomonas coronafaciens pv. porri]